MIGTPFDAGAVRRGPAVAQAPVGGDGVLARRDADVGPITARRLAEQRRDEVRDEQGRRRFHGAFTGGFSAGYFNTVGSKEGFQPAAFVPSRARRGDADPGASGVPPAADFTARVRALMDDEDEQGLTDIVAREGFDSAAAGAGRRGGATAAAGAAGTGAGFAASLLSGGGPGSLPAELVVPASAPIGTELLRALGWREGRAIGESWVPAPDDAEAQVAAAWRAATAAAAGPDGVLPGVGYEPPARLGASGLALTDAPAAHGAAGPRRAAASGGGRGNRLSFSALPGALDDDGDVVGAFDPRGGDAAVRLALLDDDGGGGGGGGPAGRRARGGGGSTTAPPPPKRARGIGGGDRAPTPPPPTAAAAAGVEVLPGFTSAPVAADRAFAAWARAHPPPAVPRGFTGAHTFAAERVAAAPAAAPRPGLTAAAASDPHLAFPGAAAAAAAAAAAPVGRTGPVPLAPVPAHPRPNAAPSAGAGGGGLSDRFTSGGGLQPAEDEVAAGAAAAAAAAAAASAGPAAPARAPGLAEGASARTSVPWLPAKLLLNRQNVADPFSPEERRRLEGAQATAAAVGAGDGHAGGTVRIAERRVPAEGSQSAPQWAPVAALPPSAPQEVLEAIFG